MTSTATLVRPGCQHNAVATGAVPSGTLRISAEGNVIVYQGLKPAVSGDAVRYDNEDVYAITKGAIAFTAGDNVYFDGTDIQTTGFVRVGRCVESAVSGDATVNVRLNRDVQIVRYSQVAAGTALTNTNVATNLGVAPTIPANTLRIGDKIKIRAQAIATATNSTDTLTVKAQLTPATSGSAVDLCTTGAVDVANNDIAYVDFELQIRTIGASGTMVGTGLVALGAAGTVTAKAVFLASATIDTTQGQVIGIQGTWSVTSSSDSCRLDVFSVEIIRA